MPGPGELRSDGGELLGTTEVFADSPRPRVELRPIGTPILGELARSLRRAYGEHRFSVCESAFEAALVDLGSNPIRRSCLMTLQPLPSAAALIASGARPLAAGVELVAMDTDDPGRYANALCRAFPPDHPDHDPEINDADAASAAIAHYFDGTIVGPFIAGASAEARSGTGDVLGAIVVSDMPGGASFEGGPWVTEVFLDPHHHRQGLGRALMTRAIGRLADGGRDQLGLSVQIDNPARHLYERLGFVTRSTWTTFVL